MADIERAEARYKRALVRRFFMRFDMTLILAGTFLGGVVANRLLFWLHVTSMPWRYALAVTASYLVFLALVRLWVAYVRWTWRALVPDADLSFDLPWSRGGGGGRVAFAGRGGGFGGGGAQGSWDGPDAPEPAGSGWLPDFSLDIDLDEKAIVILLAFFVLVLSIAGAAVYMIWSAPSILADAAFQLALSTSLVRRLRRMPAPGWLASVSRTTWLPFAIVLVLALVFGFVVRHYCPASPTLRSVWTRCLHAVPASDPPREPDRRAEPGAPGQNP